MHDLLKQHRPTDKFRYCQHMHKHPHIDSCFNDYFADLGCIDCTVILRRLKGKASEIAAL